MKGAAGERRFANPYHQPRPWNGLNEGRRWRAALQSEEVEH